EFQLISEGVASDSAVYTCLERETKVFFTFVPRSVFLCVLLCVVVFFFHFLHTFTFFLVIPR
ncbi:hypothetical protein CGC27_14915, partial [Enterococcus faecium]